LQQEQRERPRINLTWSTSELSFPWEAKPEWLAHQFDAARSKPVRGNLRQKTEQKAGGQSEWIGRWVVPVASSR